MDRAERWVLAIILLRMIVQVTVINQYGYFIDEYYYLASTQRFEFGYVDHPPLSVWLLTIVRWLFGSSLVAIRLPVILAGAVMIYIASRIARELGGAGFAIILTALMIAIVPVYLGMNKFYSMNSFALLFWTIGMYLIIRILKKDILKYWILLGITLGLGLLNKHSMLFFGFAFAIGLIFTINQRKVLTPGPMLAALIGLLIFLPNLIWQYSYDWPTLEFMHNARSQKNYFTPTHFIVGQILEIHPLLFPVWLTGLGSLLFWQQLRKFRLLAIWFLSLFTLFILTESKTYYLAPAYPVLLAAGAIVIEHLTVMRSYLRVSLIALLLLGGMLLLPLSIPLLPPSNYLAYQSWLGIEPPRLERNTQGAMPQHFASMFGWPALQSTMRDVYQSLPAYEKEQTVILGQNYGFTGALMYVRERYKLPGIGSPHNHFYLWGPPRPQKGNEAQIILTAGFKEGDLKNYCGSLQLAATAECSYCMVYRQKMPIYICRNPPVPLSKLWPRLKFYL